MIKYEQSLAHQYKRETCVKSVPSFESKLAQPLLARRGTKHLEDLLDLENSTIYRFMVGIRREREKVAMSCVYCREIFREAALKGSLWTGT